MTNVQTYYFDLFSGEKVDRDDTGSELTSEAVAAEATLLLPHLAADSFAHVEHGKLMVRVRDSSGRYIFEAQLTLTGTWLSIN